MFSDTEIPGFGVKECGAKYKAAKTSGTLGGQSWNEFRKTQCGPDAGAALSDDEIRNVWQAAGSFGSFSGLVRLALLTGLRSRFQGRPF